MAKSDEGTCSRCYSGIVRRLLCGGSLPTHPSDQFVEYDVREVGDQKPEKTLKPEADAKQAAASTPGVVARLMGLDSFPSTPLPQKGKTLGSRIRSRSADSIDFLSYFDPVKQGRQGHRRVGTSVSLREGMDDDDDDYTSAVLPLVEVDGKGEFQELRSRRKLNAVKKERGRRREKLQEKKAVRYPCKRLETEERRRSDLVKMPAGVANSTSQRSHFQGKARLRLKEGRPITKPVNAKEESVGSECVKKRSKRSLPRGSNLKKVHVEGSAPELARRGRPRKPLLSEIDHSQMPHSMAREENEKRVMEQESCHRSRMVEEICRVTKEDVKESWAFGKALKFEDFEDICQHMGEEILLVLLGQFVDELVLIYGTRNQC